MGSLGLDPARYGGHSCRIGGATVMYLEGASEIEIKTQGRWSSACYLLYIRSSLERALALSGKICSSHIERTDNCYTGIDDEDDDE
jgi:hypothetical protein